MRSTRTKNIVRLAGPIFLCAVQVVGQNANQPAPVKPTPKATTPKVSPATPAPARPVIVDASANAPQVVTLLHRLSGLKMFRLLMRSGDVKAIASVDDSFRINGQVHTNVLAALALDDGGTIAAWLPEVDAEIGPPLPLPAPKATTPAAPSSDEANAPAVTAQTWRRKARMLESPDITVIAQDRTRIATRYVGLDGVTGLSILKLIRDTPDPKPQLVEANESLIVAGQNVHVFGPEPAPEGSTATTGPVYVRIGETEGKIVKVLRGPSGSILRLEMNSARVSPANIGSVAINDKGETLGIVDTVKGSVATILPTTLIKGAVKRVTERQASVPRPWLGVSGEALEAFPVAQLERHGWESQMAKMLADQDRKGILLTSVAPGSPASKAALKPGDVILTVNNDAVRTAEDFSWVVEEAGPGGALKFTVAKPENIAAEPVEVQLGESPDFFFNFRMPAVPTAPVAAWPGSAVKVFRYAYTTKLVADGVETVALKPRVAAKLGSSGGLLVVYVEPESVAARAGLHAGDVIESINGQQVTEDPNIVEVKKGSALVYTCNIVRNKEKLVLTLSSQK